MAPDNGGRGFRGYELNPRHTSKLAWAVGGFLVNFGGLELAANGWLSGLISDELLLETLAALPLRRRIQIIRRLIGEGRVPARFTPEAESLWKRVAALSEIRNQVAHNGVIFGWHGPERDGPPDFAGVIDRRKNVKRRGPTPGLIDQSELSAAQDEAAALANRLYQLAEEVEASGGWPAHGPPDATPPAV